jgi:hypothetical protein
MASSSWGLLPGTEAPAQLLRIKNSANQCAANSGTATHRNHMTGGGTQELGLHFWSLRGW